MRPLRSWLFVPANNPRRIEKAFGFDVDAVILDLEDACAIDEKIASRSNVTDAVKKKRAPASYVRINALSTSFALGDLDAVIVNGINGVILPKSETASDILAADQVMTRLEQQARVEVQSIDLIPLVETALGLTNVLEIARACPRVKRLAFGAGDFTLDMSMTWSDDEQELHPYRAMLVLASRAARLEPPIDAPWIRMSDSAGMARSAARARNHGFGGKLCIHPDHIGAINLAFDPSTAELEHARRVLVAFAEAERDGRGAIQLDGMMIDYPIVEKARRILASVRT